MPHNPCCISVVVPAKTEGARGCIRGLLHVSVITVYILAMLMVAVGTAEDPALNEDARGCNNDLLHVSISTAKNPGYC